MRRLIAGCINRYPAEEGWENVHLDRSDRPLYAAQGFGAPAEVIADLAGLPLPDQDFDEVRCWQTLEHLTPTKARQAVSEIHRVLKPGGTFDVEVPDVDRICRAWVEGTHDRHGLLRAIYGDDYLMPDDHLNAHRWGYTEDSLRDLLADAGFDVGENYGEGVQLRFRAVRL